MKYFSQYNEMFDSSKLETNTSGFEFTTWWESFINGTAIIRPKPINNDDFKGSVFIYKEKQSILKFGVGVRELARIQSSSSITQDTYVTTKMSSVSFGDSSFIKIGQDRGYRYKSLISFDLSETQGKFVTKANLVLNSQERRSITFNIGLADKAWRENSIIWNYHPGLMQNAPVIKVTLDGTNVSKFSIDLKPFIKYFEDNSINIKENFFGLVMFTDDSNTTEYKTFLSKEYSDAQYIPTVDIEYLDPQTYISEDERIEGRAMIHGSKTNSDVLKGKAYIDREDMYSKIKCRAFIKPEKIDGKASIIVSNDILKAKANIGFLNDTLCGVAEIYGYALDDSLKAKVIIPQDKIKAKVNIQKQNNELKAKATICGAEIGFTGKSNIIANVKGISGRASIEVINSELKGTFIVKPCIYISSKASIIANVKGISAKSSIVVNNNEVNGKGIIKAINVGLTGKSNIIANVKGISAKASIRYEDISLKAKANITPHNDIKGKASIIQSNSINAISSIIQSNSIQSSAYITVDSIQCKASIIVDNDELKGKSIIKGGNTGFIGKSNIIANSNGISAKANIRELIIDSELKGSFIVKPCDSISAKASIISSTKAISGKASIMVDNDELKGKSLIKAIDEGFTGKSSIIVSSKGISAKATVTELIIDSEFKAIAHIGKVNDILNSKANILALNNINAKARIIIENNSLCVKAVIEVSDDMYAFIM